MLLFTFILFIRMSNLCHLGTTKEPVTLIPLIPSSPGAPCKPCSPQNNVIIRNNIKLRWPKKRQKQLISSSFEKSRSYNSTANFHVSVMSFRDKNNENSFPVLIFYIHTIRISKICHSGTTEEPVTLIPLIPSSPGAPCSPFSP